MTLKTPITSPYRFEGRMTTEEFAKIGQFACRWSQIEHTIGNCLRRLLDMDPKPAQVMVFPLSLDQRMDRIKRLAGIKGVTPYQRALLNELKPLVKAMQYLRNQVLHGVVVDHFDGEEPFFHLRSKGRDLEKIELFECEDLINYTAHVTQAFRFTLGEKDDPVGHSYQLPPRPPVPDFLPDECKLPKDRRSIIAGTLNFAGVRAGQ
jgi:hypothetical protein